MDTRQFVNAQTLHIRIPFPVKFGRNHGIHGKLQVSIDSICFKCFISVSQSLTNVFTWIECM